MRVTDEFMRAVLQDGEWQTRAVVSKKTMETLRRENLMRKMADAAWVCGDPGSSNETRSNAWHPCPNTSAQRQQSLLEYMFLDDSACNLAP